MPGHEPREERPHSPGLAHHSPSRPAEAHESGDSPRSNNVDPGVHSVAVGAHGAHGARDAELAAVLPGITGSGGEFRHRQHINLAFYAVRRYGMPAAVGMICGWIQQIAAYERAPQKYHHTVSRAWVELVAHHVAADPGCADFEVFAERNAALLDKRLLGRHYRSSTLAAGPARHGWVEPDLLPFPWSAQDSTAG
jgi:hypothetical protein